MTNKHSNNKRLSKDQYLTSEILSKSQIWIGSRKPNNEESFWAPLLYFKIFILFSIK